jgi:hypothetical protein
MLVFFASIKAEDSFDEIKTVFMQSCKINRGVSKDAVAKVDYADFSFLSIPQYMFPCQVVMDKNILILMA